MADANIPEAYWALSYKNFSSTGYIKSSTENYIAHLSERYAEGESLCYAGSPGTGKTMSACTILKAALKQGFTAYYTSLSDVASYLTDHAYKTAFYHKLINVDFLCIDEVDSRHFADTESSENFFGRSLERVFRYRVQNRLPIIFATNHATLNEAFNGQFKKIFESISSQSVTVIPSIGIDYRRTSGTARQ
jgi:DNA replication protein DnaC